MTSTKYIGMDVHKKSISIAVMNSVGKVVMECVVATKASITRARCVCALSIQRLEGGRWRLRRMRLRGPI
jgi:hypothetical protein